jgi:hypothetical protein
MLAEELGRHTAVENGRNGAGRWGFCGTQRAQRGGVLGFVSSRRHHRRGLSGALGPHDARRVHGRPDKIPQSQNDKHKAQPSPVQTTNQSKPGPCDCQGPSRALGRHAGLLMVPVTPPPLFS